MANIDVRITKIRKKLGSKLPTVTIIYRDGSIRKVGSLRAIDEILTNAADIVSITPDNEMLQNGLNMLLDSETGKMLQSD